MGELVVNRRDILKRLGGLAAAAGVAAALPGIEAPKAIPVESETMVIDEDAMREAFAKMFAPGTLMTGALMADAMMMAVTGKIPDQHDSPREIEKGTS